MPTTKAMIRNIDGEIGYKQREFLKGGAAGSRLVGMLSKPGREQEWLKALEHISDHFHSMPGKKRHTLFGKKFRNTETLKDYIRRAASAPSETFISRLRVNEVHSGAPCAVIMRKFSEPIGEDDGDIYLFVVMDYQGTLVSAYPGNELAYLHIRSPQ